MDWRDQMEPSRPGTAYFPLRAPNNCKVSSSAVVMRCSPRSSKEMEVKEDPAALWVLKTFAIFKLLCNETKNLSALDFRLIKDAAICWFMEGKHTIVSGVSNIFPGPAPEDAWAEDMVTSYFPSVAVAENLPAAIGRARGKPSMRAMGFGRAGPGPW